jgi:SpoIID/LytB domain protein
MEALELERDGEGSPPLERDRGAPPVLWWAPMGVTSSTYHRLVVAFDRPRRAGGLLACVLAALALCSAGAGGTAFAATLIVEGAGEGHGVGMSQDGALGYAKHGWSYQAILAHYYTGTTIGQAPANAMVRVLVGSRVVRVALERYVRGVVSAEMPATWPLPALEAQAIASRTYALTAHAGGSRFDVYSDTRSQVYMGVAAETAQTNSAVSATAGQIVVYGTHPPQPATTYFFASSGGMTEDIESSFLGAQPEPWLRGVPDPFDSGPPASWSKSMSFASAAARLKGLVQGAFRGIEVLRRGASPRIVSAEVLGTRGATVVGGPELATRLGLASTWNYFSVRSGTRVRREPDLSRRTPAGRTPAGGAPATPLGRPGGASAPGVASTAAPTGGAPAE